MKFPSATKFLTAMGQVLLPLGILALATAAQAQSDVDLEVEDNRIGYAMGVNLGMNLQADPALDGLAYGALVAGLRDVFEGNVQLDDAQLMTAMQTLMQRAQAAQQAEAEAAAAAAVGNLAASEAFHAENADRDGVITLDSGLQYQVLESGSGGASPAVTDSVVAHYHGTLTDGSVFDSSVDRGAPATFALNQVIAGWTEALQLMSVGDKWRLYIPPGLAYGERSPTPAIPPNSTLIFDVELLEIQ